MCALHSSSPRLNGLMKVCNKNLHKSSASDAALCGPNLHVQPASVERVKEVVAGFRCAFSCFEFLFDMVLTTKVANRKLDI